MFAHVSKNDSNKLQNHLVLLIVGITFGVGIIFSAVFTSLYRGYLENSLAAATSTNLKFLTDSINHNLDSVNQLIRWSQVNTTIGNYVEVKSPQKYGILSVNAHERLTEELQNNPASDMIHRVVIGNMNGRFIQYVPATYSTTLNLGAAILLLPDNTPSDNASLIQVLGQTGNSLYNYYKTRLKCGIGTKVNTPLSLSDSYQTARASFSNITDDGSMVLISDTSSISADTHNIFNISIFKEDLNRALSEYDSVLFTSVITQMIELLEEHPDHYIQSLDAACNVLFLSISLLPDGEEVISSLFADYGDGYRSIYRMNSTDQVTQWMRVFCERLGSYFEEQRKHHRHHVVENVKKYIASHLSDKLILNEVAAIYGITPNYLSTLFKKYNDCGFSEYIAACKITQAKRMMNEGNQKIYEIADMLGFDSVFYFSKVFKKLEGISPSEYLSKI